MGANDRQIGGDHYQSQFQFWDFAIQIPLGYLEGSTCKYIVRHRNKDGIQDLHKAQHYLDKLIETTEYNAKRNHSKDEIKALVSDFADANKLDVLELVFIYILCTYVNLTDLEHAYMVLNRLITEAVITDIKP